jgi:alpha-beta hydrolase superfamily lysophospholipase
LFRSLGYHVVAIDYRGYGDSTGESTEIDVVRDALFTYEFLKRAAPWATIYIWGHSLGKYFFILIVLQISRISIL